MATQTQTEPQVQEIPQTVSINGVDYSLEDAQSFIEKGKQTSELEKQWNTSVDKVWPEYGKLTQEQRNWESQKQEYEAKLKAFETKQDAGTDTPEDLAKVQEAARKAGIVLNDDLTKQGYIKKEDLPGLFQTYQQEQDAVKKILDNATELEKEINGEDGRPKFNKKAVLAYASAYNISDLKAAYEDMNKDEIDLWKSKQITSQKSSGLKTLSGGGAKSGPKETKVTDDNVNDLLREALGGGES